MVEELAWEHFSRKPQDLWDVLPVLVCQFLEDPFHGSDMILDLYLGHCALLLASILVGSQDISQLVVRFRRVYIILLCGYGLCGPCASCSCNLGMVDMCNFQECECDIYRVAVFGTT